MRPRRTPPDKIAQFSKFFDGPIHRIGLGVSKHLIENRLPEPVEPGDSTLPQPSNFVGLIENGRDALLLVEWRKRDFQVF